MKKNLVKINLIHPSNEKGVNPDKSISFYMGKKPEKILKKESINQTALSELKILSTIGYGVQDIETKKIIFEYFNINFEVINKVQNN